MKRCALLAVFCLGSMAQAARFDIQAEVGQVRYHEATNTLGAAYQKMFWFGLKNAPSVSTCAKYGNEIAVIVPDNNSSALAMILSAKSTGGKLLVTIDDSVTLLGYCRLQYITLL